MIYLAETREVVVISGVGPWPKAATTEYFTERFGGRVPPGILNTVVPAAPGIWIAALERYGTLSFGEVAAAAIRFARDGFPVYPMFRELLIEHRHEFADWPTTAAIFMPDGRIPDEGALFVQSDLAATLQYLADEETAHRGKGRRRGAAGRARRLLPGRHRRRDDSPAAGLGRPDDRGRPGVLPRPLRNAVPDPLRRYRRLWLRAVVPGPTWCCRR